MSYYFAAKGDTRLVARKVMEWKPADLPETERLFIEQEKETILRCLADIERIDVSAGINRSFAAVLAQGSHSFVINGGASDHKLNITHVADLLI